MVVANRRLIMSDNDEWPESTGFDRTLLLRALLKRLDYRAYLFPLQNPPRFSAESHFFIEPSSRLFREIFSRPISIFDLVTNEIFYNLNPYIMCLNVSTNRLEEVKNA